MGSRAGQAPNVEPAHVRFCLPRGVPTRRPRSGDTVGGVPDELLVGVFPAKADRWVAVISSPAGDFSTEATSPEAVDGEVAAAIREVLGEPARPYRLVDEAGSTWTLDVAARQAAILRDREQS